MKRIIDSDRVFNMTINIMLVIITFVTIYPLWFVIIASVSSPSSIVSGEVILFPKGLNIDAYISLFKNKRICSGYSNSILYI